TAAAPGRSPPAVARSPGPWWEAPSQPFWQSRGGSHGTDVRSRGGRDRAAAPLYPRMLSSEGGTMLGTRIGLGRSVVLGVCLALALLLLAAKEAQAGKYVVSECGWHVN